jgi:branched-chain amino acid aminotransferase
MHQFLPIAYFQDQFVAFENANISVATHALHYGTAAFGGLRGIPDPQNPQQILLFRLDRHCQRLSQSATFLNYQISADKIQQIIIDFIQKNQPTTSFYIRPLVYSSGLGIAPRLHNIEKDFLVYGLEMGDYLSADGVSCRISSWYRQEDRSFPLRGKISGAYITSALAKTEAVESGFDEAILMNTQGKVCEATGMNIFVVRNGQLITPGFEQDILEGITRDSILKIAQDLGIPTLQRPIDKSELLIADEVFLSGTAAKITPVKQIETFHLPKAHPITDKIKETLTTVTENRNPNYQDWVFVIPLNS